MNFYLLVSFPNRLDFLSADFLPTFLRETVGQNTLFCFLAYPDRFLVGRQKLFFIFYL